MKIKGFEKVFYINEFELKKAKSINGRKDTINSMKNNILFIIYSLHFHQNSCDIT